jgi:hypothetical protein
MRPRRAAVHDPGGLAPALARAPPPRPVVGALRTNFVFLDGARELGRFDRSYLLRSRTCWTSRTTRLASSPARGARDRGHARLRASGVSPPPPARPSARRETEKAPLSWRTRARTLVEFAGTGRGPDLVPGIRGGEVGAIPHAGLRGPGLGGGTALACSWQAGAARPHGRSSSTTPPPSERTNALRACIPHPGQREIEGALTSPGTAGLPRSLPGPAGSSGALARTAATSASCPPDRRGARLLERGRVAELALHRDLAVDVRSASTRVRPKGV